MVCIPIPLGRSHTLLQTKATQEIAIVYFSHKLLGEIYTEAWLRCEKSKSLFDATLGTRPRSTLGTRPRSLRLGGEKLFPYLNKAVNKKSRIQAKTIILSAFCSEIFFWGGGGYRHYKFLKRNPDAFKIAFNLTTQSFSFKTKANKMTLTAFHVCSPAS